MCVFPALLIICAARPRRKLQWKIYESLALVRSPNFPLFPNFPSLEILLIFFRAGLFTTLRRECEEQAAQTDLLCVRWDTLHCFA